MAILGQREELFFHRWRPIGEKAHERHVERPARRQVRCYRDTRTSKKCKTGPVTKREAAPQGNHRCFHFVHPSQFLTACANRESNTFRNPPQFSGTPGCARCRYNKRLCHHNLQ
jgi:hypothetical protein